MKSKKHTIQEMLNSFPGLFEIVGDPQRLITGVARPDKAGENELVFISADRKDKIDIVGQTRSKAIIMTAGSEEFDKDDKTFLVSQDPKLTFSILANKYFLDEEEPGIHPSAVISEKATIGEHVFIGPHTYIGTDVTIGDHTIIYGNTFIYKNTTIGKHVKIGANCSIAAEGFGYNKNSEGVPIQFPHFGGVIIEDFVEIGCNTCIDRGSLSDTHLKKHVKVDNLVHIAHNVVVGENSYIIANAMIGGSTVIGKDSWVAPSSSLRDAIQIGDNTIVGMGAVIVKSIANGQTWTGNPGKQMEEFKKIQAALKKLSEGLE